MQPACGHSKVSMGKERPKALLTNRTRPAAGNIQRTWPVPSKTREPEKIGNTQKSVLSDFILERKQKSITLQRRNKQVNIEQITEVLAATGALAGCLLSDTRCSLISVTSLIVLNTSLLNVSGTHLKSSLPQGGCDIKAGNRPKGQ